jgi:hypothetical protein
MDLLRKRLIYAGLDVISVRSAYPTLEDIFLSMTAKPKTKLSQYDECESVRI